jgi:preprotein translocase SecE subunit
MDKKAVRKIMTMCFMAAGLLTWLTVGVLFRALAGAFGIVQQLYGQDIYSHGIPLVCGVAVFAVLTFNPKIVVWAEDVILEVSKVVWPSQKDTMGMTIVVIMMVLISGVALFLFDNLARFSLQMLDKLIL